MKRNKLFIILASSLLGLAACQEGIASSSSLTSSSSKETASSSETSSSASAASKSSETTSSSSVATSSSATSSSATSETSSSSSAAESSSASSSTSEPPANPDIFYADDTFVYAGESDAGTGRFVYWAGDGGTVASATKANGKYTLAYSSTGQWYGVQIFYKLPYAEVNDTYDIATTFTSNVAGNITVNSAVVSVGAGETPYEFSPTQGTGATISIQLGVQSTGAKLAGSSFSLSVPVIHDLTPGASYHEVRFLNGSDVVKDIEVKHGKKVTAPADPIPADGYIFDGWYDGPIPFNPDDAVLAPATYVAKFITEAEATRYTVTFKNGDATMGTALIIEGRKVTVPSSVVAPFGYGIAGWYTDAALTQVWDLAAAVVTHDLTLYAKMQVTPTGTFMNTADTGFVIPAINLSHGSAGELIVSGFNGWGSGDAWVIQVNFAPVPSGDSGTNYTLSFKYKINGAGADAQIYDNGTIGNLVQLSQTASWATGAITFQGGQPTANSKLTFELGKIPTSVVIDFELSDISLQRVPA